jgi:glycosyltransferase involved in cell wall biosynthesis
MKIAHVVSTYPPYYGGMGNVVFKIVDELAQRGHDVQVMTPLFEDETKKEEARQEIQEKKDYAERLAPSIQFGNAARLPQIKSMLDDFDLVHLHYPFFGTAELVRKWKIKHPEKPLVITYHMDARGDGLKGFIFKAYEKFWMPKILKSADLLICSSFDYIKSSDAGFLYSKSPEKWIQLPFGVDIERFCPRPKPEPLFLRHNLSSDLPTILFVGGMDSAHYFKGITVLLNALNLLKENGVEVQAVFVGDGDLKEAYSLRSVGYGLKNVHFVGRVSDDELPYYYNLADLFVLPSINRCEAFGMVLLEAMASGVPVLASDLDGVRTVAMDGGVVVTPNNIIQLANRIQEFFISENDRTKWAVSARRVAEEKYSWDIIIEQLEKSYYFLANNL